MPVNLLHVLDPELIIPSVPAANDLQFWLRLHEWAEDREPRIGPATLKALNNLAQNPPSLDRLAVGDFWTILGKYSSRGFTASPVPREVCADHLASAYVPQQGASDNITRLVQDLRAAGPDCRIALRTIESCWSIDSLEGCPACYASKLSYIYRNTEPEFRSVEVAQVWRQAYMDEHAGDPTQLQGFASKLFPAIEFSPDAWKRLNTLVGSPEEITQSIISHLAVLNDFAASIWAKNLTTEDRQAALGSKGVTSSPEGPRTHKNPKAMRKRDFDFRCGRIRCEWHTKMRPDINRIYFEISEGKVLVGTIIDHLPT